MIARNFRDSGLPYSGTSPALFIGKPALSIPWEEGEAARVTLELHGLAVMVGYS
jgi:hypothetical protein